MITGEVGTGKTTLARYFLGRLPEGTATAVVLYPALTAAELLQTILDDLHAPREGTSLKELVDALHRFLLKARAQGRDVVLLIDEAQDLSPEVLEQIRLISNLETDTDKLIQIVLIGQSELAEMLGRRELRQLAQRVTARYHLAPLVRGGRPTTTCAIAWPWPAARARSTFTPRALAAVHGLSSRDPAAHQPDLRSRAARGVRPGHPGHRGGHGPPGRDRDRGRGSARASTCNTTRPWSSAFSWPRAWSTPWPFPGRCRLRATTRRLPRLPAHGAGAGGPPGCPRTHGRAFPRHDPGRPREAPPHPVARLLVWRGRVPHPGPLGRGSRREDHAAHAPAPAPPPRSSRAPRDVPPGPARHLLRGPARNRGRRGHGGRGRRAALPACPWPSSTATGPATRSSSGATSTRWPARPSPTAPRSGCGAQLERLGYGADTKAAVLRFQQESDLIADGVVGSRTLMALYSRGPWPRPRLAAAGGGAS